MKKFSKPLSVLLSVFLILSAVPFCLAEDESGFDPQITLFKNSGAVITGTEVMTASCDSELVTVESAGDTVTVTANDGAVGIAKVTVNALEGFENTLSDSELNNADLYGDTSDGGDGTNAAYAESAVIKGKVSANITLTGKGVLNLNCATKNAIKLGTSGVLTVESLTLNIVSANHGISCDNIININSGSINITASGDGIRTDPDAVSAEDGTAAQIYINGGSITINAGGDGIQSAQDITITDGSFDITTGTGYDDESFNSDTDSRKGIKASFSSDEDADTEDSTNSITVSGGRFVLNTADDSIHSDSYICITGGDFEIKTGDDGIHADTTLDVGQNDADNSLININILTCYEGLEAGTVNIYSGNISVVSSDDGINAAGGSDENQGPAGGGFNPGGGRPGQGGPGGNPGGNGGSAPGQGGSSDYTINIYGGEIFVNAEGDGLDSNGDLNLLGGSLVIWGMKAGGDNEPLDCDGTLTIDGATVFGAGSSAMTTVPKNSQGYITSRASAASGKTVNILQNGETVFKIKAVKNINYIIYSSPDVTDTSEWSIVIDDSSLEDDDYALGDVTLDGRITSSDALLALQASVGKITLESARQNAADVDKDGSVTATDALLILQYSVGKISSF